ncbi:TraX family protein [Hungatella hathewayi]|uniref:TraX family protein n=1 Tax=Hungatella hathewayi TaxID=154046 RepID=UPI0024182CDC|nr:TraX family protein [Hungatella hathewayi]
MLLDHVGGAFFPQYPIFRWLGRLAFPIFCYCLTVGLLYTHDIKRYFGRLALFCRYFPAVLCIESGPFRICRKFK